VFSTVKLVSSQHYRLKLGMLARRHEGNKTTTMSQHAAARQGALVGCGGGRGTTNFRYHPRTRVKTKGFKLTIGKIALNTFNMGQNKFTAQFTQS
jgi:hypothetical protein